MSVRLYGLSVDADFELNDSGVPDDAEPDVVIRTDPTLDDWPAMPPGDVLLDFETHEPWYTLIGLSDGGYFYRVHSIGDFVISADARRVRMALHRDVDPEMNAIMTTGTLLSLLLFLRGHSVFHGSAVALPDGRAIGFVGHSGQGKTTMATLMCAEGAKVVTDDVLVVDDPGGRPTVRQGSRELRLRSGTAEIAERVQGATSRTSSDDRRVLAPPPMAADQLPLAAVLIPVPTRDGSPMRFERLRGGEAAFALAQYPRLMGWRDAEVVRQFVKDGAAMASRVPVFAARVPWGPPFPDAMVPGLLEALSDG